MQQYLRHRHIGRREIDPGLPMHRTAPDEDCQLQIIVDEAFSLVIFQRSLVGLWQPRKPAAPSHSRQYPHHSYPAPLIRGAS